jgi:ankyrin repeat protein
MASELFDAIECHDAKRLAEALAKGDDPNALQSRPPHFRALHAAIEELEEGGPISSLVLLLRAGARVDERDGNGDATPLLMALFRGQHEAARLLLALGADPNAVGAEGDSPLRYCVEMEDLRMVEELLLYGAAETIDASGGPEGLSALGRAVRNLNVPLVKVLLEAGASPEATDTDRRSAKDLLPPPDNANQDRRNEVEALLRAPRGGSGSG